MEHEQDFSKLRQLLAAQKRELPCDPQVDQFLIELHRRQRVQLLKPASPWARATAWLQEKVAGLELVPSLSYGAALAAIAFAAIVGLSQQVQVTSQAGQPLQLSLRMGAHDNNAFALVPTSFSSLATPSKATEGMNFEPSRSDTTTTRFVLANASPRAYDATVAF